MPDYEVIRMGTPSDCIKLYEKMGGESQPLSRILELVTRSGGRYCIKWEDTSNDEWRAEYDGLYSKIFPPQPNSVSRLDFFKHNPNKKKKEENVYLGYVSMRPGPIKTVVEAIIKPPTDTQDHYLLCESEWTVSYPYPPDGDLVVDSVANSSPFVQQDGVIGICAHASLRMLSMILSEKFLNCNRVTVREIKQQVSTMPLLEGSHMLSSGLWPFDVASSIEAMGASATLYSIDGGKETRRGLSIERLVYPYLESGIPVLAGITTATSGHALLLVGHTYDKDSWWQQAETGYYPYLVQGTEWIPSYSWAPEFIIQDDNFGPYLSHQRTLLGLISNFIVVPTPEDCPIYLPGHLADKLVTAYLNRIGIGCQ